jgi:hypothetical protein
MGQSHPTGLTPNLLKLFEARPPLEHKPPVEKRKLPAYTGTDLAFTILRLIDGRGVAVVLNADDVYCCFVDWLQGWRSLYRGLRSLGIQSMLRLSQPARLRYGFFGYQNCR